MLLVAIRTFILYIVTLLAMKAMGKRQIGQLQPFELVGIIVISEMAAIAIQSTTVPLLNSIIPIVSLAIFQISIALLNLKSERIRSLFCGTPTVVIKNGEILEEQMRNLRMNVNDLLEQMRAKGFFDLAEVEYAVMETNGQLSVMPRSDCRPLQPSDIHLAPDNEIPAITVILDGKVNQNALTELQHDEAWLKKRLAKHSIKSFQEVFYASIDGQGHLFCQLKEKNPAEGSPPPIRENDETAPAEGGKGAAKGGE